MFQYSKSSITLNQLFHSVVPVNYRSEEIIEKSGGQLWSCDEEREWDEESIDSQSSHSTSSSTSSKSSRYKTERCRVFYETGQCLYGDKCMFAHGVHELNVDPCRPTNYKTRVCTTFQYNGYCSFGPRCAFIHSKPDPQQLIDSVVSAAPRPPMPENLTKVRPEFYPSDILVRKRESDITCEDQLLPSLFITEHWARLPVFRRLTRSLY